MGRYVSHHQSLLHLVYISISIYVYLCISLYIDQSKDKYRLSSIYIQIYKFTEIDVDIGIDI